MATLEGIFFKKRQHSAALQFGETQVPPSPYEIPFIDQTKRAPEIQVKRGCSVCPTDCTVGRCVRPSVRPSVRLSGQVLTDDEVVWSPSGVQGKNKNEEVSMAEQVCFVEEVNNKN